MPFEKVSDIKEQKKDSSSFERVAELNTDSFVDKNKEKSGGMQSALSGLGKTYLKTKIGVDSFPLNNEEKGPVSNAITTGQTVASFTPSSPITEFLGEYSKSILRGEDPSVARNKGAAAFATDIAFLGFGGVLSKVAPKLGKKLIKKAVTDQSGKTLQFNDKVAKRAIKTTPITFSSNRGFDELAKNGRESVLNLKETQGQIVKKAKDKARAKSLLVNKQPSIDFVEQGKKRLNYFDPPSKAILNEEGNRITPLLSRVPATDPKGRKAVKVVEDQLKANFDPLYENAEQVLENIDSSDEFQEIYKVLSDPKEATVLTNGQKFALSARNKFRDVMDDAVIGVLEKNNMQEEKALFSKISQVYKQPQLQNALKNQDSFASALEGSMRPKRSGLFSDFEFVDELLPKSERFVDKAIDIQVTQKVPDKFVEHLFNLNFGSATKQAPKALGKSLLRGKPKPPKAVRSLLRRGASQLSSYLVEEE